MQICTLTPMNLCRSYKGRAVQVRPLYRQPQAAQAFGAQLSQGAAPAFRQPVWAHGQVALSSLSLPAHSDVSSDVDSRTSQTFVQCKFRGGV